MGTWLVTGGAGYIGAHVVRELKRSGRDVVVLDDLSSGRASRVPPGVPLVVGSIGDPDAVNRALSAPTDGEGVTGLMHFAAYKQVGESVHRPIDYWDNNVTGLTTLLSLARSSQVKDIVFSSSAGVYGQPDVGARMLLEDDYKEPINPYGASKLAGEWIVDASSREYGWHCVSLRYFNVAGAGARHLGDQSVVNLVPMILERLWQGRSPAIFGDDYPTPDGTCVRDYTHVQDLARAHVAAADRLESESQKEPHSVFNLGTGRGYSVREVISAVRELSGLDFEPEVRTRRPGDPPKLVADPTRANDELDWQSRYGLKDMVLSALEAWEFEHGPISGR